MTYSITNTNTLKVSNSADGRKAINSSSTDHIHASAAMLSVVSTTVGTALAPYTAPATILAAAPNVFMAFVCSMQLWDIFGTSSGAKLTWTLTHSTSSSLQIQLGSQVPGSTPSNRPRCAPFDAYPGLPGLHEQHDNVKAHLLPHVLHRHN